MDTLGNCRFKLPGCASVTDCQCGDIVKVKQVYRICYVGRLKYKNLYQVLSILPAQ